MAEDNGEIIRRSLDAVDRHRKRLFFGLVGLAVLLLLTFVHGIGTLHMPEGHVRAVLAHFFILLIWVTALAVVVIIQIAVMTKRILRAIELAAKK